MNFSNRIRATLLLLVGISAINLMAQEPKIPPEEVPTPTSPPTAASPLPNGLVIPDPSTLSCDSGCDGKFDFKKIPPVRAVPPQGFFPVLPTKGGYYSLKDQLLGIYREKPPKFGAGPRTALVAAPSFDFDYRYLDDPKNQDFDLFDPIKRFRIGDDWLLSSGGQISSRYMNEGNSRLGRVRNTYDLFRVRTYADLWYRDNVRLFAEFIYADSIGYELTPLPIDRTRADILNLFADLKVGEVNEAPVYLRIGRQELLLGSQRLISTLDWSNTRRRFDGVRLMTSSEKIDFDLFWVQPVIQNASKLDSVDHNQNFAGAWLTYRPQKGEFLDFYWLFLDNTNRTTQMGVTINPQNSHTFGTRYTGSRNGFLWDAELMGQFLERGQSNGFAGATATGVGYNWADAPMNPTFWLYYDYASGTRNPGANNNYSTFNPLYPFGHYYLGWADLVGRQNIQDLNMHLYLYPTNWITCWLQFHRFWLAERRDALYNAGGNAIRRDATGRAGNDVGSEVDFVVNFHLTKHADFLVGYSRLFGGDFLKNTRGNTGSINSDLFYLMTSYRW